jgi:hypothetical protein
VASGKVLPVYIDRFVRFGGDKSGAGGKCVDVEALVGSLTILTIILGPVNEATMPLALYG